MNYRRSWTLFIAATALMTYFVANTWSARVIVFIVMAVPISLWALKHKPVEKSD